MLKKLGLISRESGIGLLLLCVFSVGVAFFLSLRYPFYEDGIYRAFVLSIAHDFDFNIINQIASPLDWIVTKNYYHPTHHSIIQTPLLSIFYGFELLLKNVFGISTKFSLHMSSIVVQFLCIGLGVKIVNQTLKELGMKFVKIDYAIFIFTTSLFFFLFFNFNVIEIYFFPFTAYLLYSYLLMCREEYSKISYASLGVCSSLLLLSKETYSVVVGMLVITILYDDWRTKKKNILHFILGSLPLCFIVLFNKYLQYGEILFPMLSFGMFCDYTFGNIYRTLKYSYFGVGGLFYSNIIFFPIYFYWLFSVIKKSVKRDLEFRFVLFCWIWINIAFFQTIFLIAPLVDDHYVGRLVFMALPVLIVGFVGLLKNIRLDYKKYIFGVLAIFQLFSLGNFLVIDNKNHYQYLLQKISLDKGEWKNYLETLFFVDVSIIDILSIVMFGIVLFVLIRKINNNTIGKVIKYLVIAEVIILFPMTILNYSYGQKNSQNYISKERNYQEKVIGDGAHIFVFNYIMDGMKADYLATPERYPWLKKKINELRKEYFNIIKKQVVKGTPEFNHALDTYDFDYSPYNEEVHIHE